VGPLAHVATGKAVKAPALASVWMDAPHLLRVVNPELAPLGQRVANATHGWPGLLAAAAIWGSRGVAGWALHVALDTISHDEGMGSHGRLRKVWLP
jgi:hypothetical protein